MSGIPKSTDQVLIPYRTMLIVCFFIGLAGICSPRSRGSESDWSSRSSRVLVKRDVVYGDQHEPMHRGDIYVARVLAKAKELPTPVPSDRQVDESNEGVASKASAESTPRVDSTSIPRKRPAVLVIHGGAWTLGDKVNDKLHAIRLAEKGYWVMSINYRLAPKHPFPAQLDDCKRALRWMHDNADSEGIDRDRIGVWGYSAGGQLAALTALDPPSSIPAVQACVCGGAPFDLTQLPSETLALRGVFGGTPAEVPQRYRDASPVFFVHAQSPPLFLFHGSKDWLVPEQMAISMRKTLEEFEVDHEWMIVPGKGHLATFVDRDVSEKSFEFLDRYLKPDSTWRSGEDKSE